MRAASKRTETPEPFILLQTTRLQALFDPATGFLRRVQSGNRGILMAIYGAVRDENWNTVLPIISDVSLYTAPDEFELSFIAECIDRKAHFTWNGMIRGRGGDLEFSFDGRAGSEFYRNRIGLCVLHSSVQYAGKPCGILKADGSWEESTFPDSIAPHQPFRQVSGMRWNPAPDLAAELGFEGDIFETEDQRNWTDASFKTYSTPLEIPLPVKIVVGTEVHQRMLLKVEAPLVPISGPTSEAVTVRYAEVGPVTRPPIGLCLPRHFRSSGKGTLQLLRDLQLAHLRVELFPGRSGWLAEWDLALVQAGAIGAGLHCALFVEDEAGLEAFARKALQSPVPIMLCLVFDVDANAAPDRWLAAARSRLGKIAPVAIGTNGNFAELNRNRPSGDAPVCFSITPQCHAFDDMSLMENLEAQGDTIRTARGFGCDQVVISPITLKPRSIGSGAIDQSLADPRQRTLFGAAWTLGSLARLTPMAGVDSLTYFETTGPFGIIEQEPEAIVYPTYHLLLDLAGFPEVIAMDSSEPLCVAGLALIKPCGARRILMANLTPDSRTILMEGGGAIVRILDEQTLEQATMAPDKFRALSGKHLEAVDGNLLVELAAYATACIDFDETCPGR
ncbi:MAG: hypothetical protein JWL59_1974 [Chthoniobacteraceae bacterium]|nr:hypothetical protein [Chthoniobacteraceae bacterium]